MEKPVFKPEFFRELAHDNPLGLTISPEEAEAWWLYIAWPSYKTYKYVLHKKAVRRWWSYLSMKDLGRTREAILNAELEHAAEEQERLDDEYWAQCDQFGDQKMVGALRVIMGGKEE